MAKIKGIGTILKTDWQTPGTFESIGCIFGLTPPGIEYDTVSDEQCLNESGVAAVDLGDEQPDEITFTMAWEPRSEIAEAMWARALSQDTKTYHIKYPNEADEHVFDAQIRVFKPDEIERNTFMRVPVTLIRRSAISWMAAAVNIAYPQPEYTFPTGSAITAITPSALTGSPVVTTSEALPTGLSISSSTGVITGTPTSVQTLKYVTIIATHSSGLIDTTSIAFTIVAP